eukprot:gene57550-biopygen13176
MRGWGGLAGPHRRTHKGTHDSAANTNAGNNSPDQSRRPNENADHCVANQDAHDSGTDITIDGHTNNGTHDTGSHRRTDKITGNGHSNKGTRHPGPNRRTNEIAIHHDPHQCAKHESSYQSGLSNKSAGDCHPNTITIDGHTNKGAHQPGSNRRTDKITIDGHTNKGTYRKN